MYGKFSMAVSIAEVNVFTTTRHDCVAMQIVHLLKIFGAVQ